MTIPAVGADPTSDSSSNVTSAEEGDVNATTTTTPAVKPKRVACLVPGLTPTPTLSPTESEVSEDGGETDSRVAPDNADAVSSSIEESG